MPILGIIGGIAPSSTIEYYRRIVNGVGERTAEKEYPRVIVNSINLRVMLPLFEAGDAAGAIAFLSGEVARLARAGADLALFAANTPHLYFKEIANASAIPLLSIVDAVVEAAQRQRLRRLLLLGTGFTMRATYYADMLRPAGIELLRPADDDINALHSLYMSELVPGRFTNAAREQVLAVIERSASNSEIDGVILGGTELPLALDMPTYHGLPLLDSTQIHVERAIAALGY